MLIAVAPVLLGVFELPGLRRFEGWRGYAVRILTVATPVVLAVLLVLVLDRPEVEAGDGGYDLDSYLTP